MAFELGACWTHVWACGVCPQNCTNFESNSLRKIDVSWRPRLRTIWQAVLQGKSRAPMDKRYLENKKHQPKEIWEQIHSHLQSLYASVAETLPGDEGVSVEDLDEPDGYAQIHPGVPEEFGEICGKEQRFLPPGSVFECWRQYQSIGGVGCYNWFRQILAWRLKKSPPKNKKPWRKDPPFNSLKSLSL